MSGRGDDRIDSGPEVPPKDMAENTLVASLYRAFAKAFTDPNLYRIEVRAGHVHAHRIRVGDATITITIAIERGGPL